MVTKDNILSKVSQEQIMDYYFPQIVSIGAKYHNPFRSDSNSGCYFAYSKAGNLIFFDNSNPEYGGDCFKIVMLKHNLNFFNALLKINEDFKLKLTDKKHVPDKLELTSLRKNQYQERISRKNLKRTHYKVISRKWNVNDENYWLNNYGISLELLERYGIFPVNRYQQRNWDWSYFETKYQYDDNEDDPCYCFTFKSNNDSVTSVKLYRPFNKKFKWCGNVDSCDIQGYDQLPDDGELLIIASSMKDLLTLTSIGYNVIAPQGETIPMPKSIMNDLSKRFKRIVFIFDRDETGIKFSKKEAELNQCEYRILPYVDNLTEKDKDFADYRKALGKEKFIATCQELLQEKTNESF